jgi:very-short-patch-repair endonuclease
MVPEPASVHVTVPTDSGRGARQGIRIHRSVTLTADVRAVREGFPVTSMARTLLDVAATEPRRVVERAIEGADVARVFDLRAIEALAPRGSRVPGAKRLYAVLDEELIGATITRSDLEEAMLALCRAHGLPRPLFNHFVEGWEVDCLWPEQRLVVEVQSTKYHATPQRIARDADKEADLLTAGYLVLHVADVHVMRRPVEVARRVARFLAGSRR